MIVCLCNRINEREIDKAIEAGAKTPLGVQKSRGCRFNCGACKAMIGDRIASKSMASASKSASN